ncbi:MAG: hypothetical protein ABIP03_12400 [Aquihabitans sp.]
MTTAPHGSTSGPVCPGICEQPGAESVAPTELERHNLITGLEEALGPERTFILMAYLPPVGWADVATKQDLEHLHQVLALDIAVSEERIRAEMAELGGSLRAEMAELRGSLRVEMAELRTDLTAEMSGLRADLTGEMSGLRADLTGEMSGLGADLTGEMSGLRADLTREMSGLRADLTGSFTDFRNEIHADRRTAQRQLIFVLVVALVSMVVALSGLG